MTGKMFFEAVLGAQRADVASVASTLEVDLAKRGRVTQADADVLWAELSYYGSNDVAYALRGFQGVDYPEIVRDVCKQRKVPGIDRGDGDAAVLHNENALLAHMFSEAWNMMSEAEHRELLRGMDIDESEVKANGAAAFFGVMAVKSGGFFTYQVAVMVANALSRALVGRGLAVGANAALTRGLGIALGPVGLAVSGAFALNDLAAPATRKTLPVVLQVALLRRVRQSETAVSSKGPRRRRRSTAKRSAPRGVRRKPTSSNQRPDSPDL